MDTPQKIELSKSSELLSNESSSNAFNEVWGTLAEHRDTTIKTGLVAASLTTAALTYSFFRGNVGGVSAAIGRMLGRESLPEGSVLFDGLGAGMEGARLGSAKLATGELGEAEQFGARLEHAARFGGGLGHDAELDFDRQAGGTTIFQPNDFDEALSGRSLSSFSVGFGGEYSPGLQAAMKAAAERGIQIHKLTE